MRHAKVFGKGFSLIVEVNADNLIRASQPCTLDDIETDPTEPKDNNIRAGFYFCGVYYGTDTRRDTTADVTNFIEGGIFSHFGNGNFG